MYPGTLCALSYQLLFKCRTIINSSSSNEEPEVQINDLAKVADTANYESHLDAHACKDHVINHVQNGLKTLWLNLSS